MSIPAGITDVPSVVRSLAGGDELVAVWRNDYGGLTFRAGARYIKWCPRNLETSLSDEADRLRWARPHSPVPRVIEHGGDAEAEWLVTAALPGDSAVAPRWVADPAAAVRAVGEGLRALHDALPVAECPFVWDVPSRIANAAARGIHLPPRFEHPPSIDLAVVCHADACCPNTLIAEDGRWLAHVDLGQLGVADRWADIAVASMSTEWNYGPGWEDALIAAYGVAPDRERLAFYRDLWNAT
ncbi:MAG TPA: aminoglycoside 3'-phosphotransferase [Microbacterium sp.]|nr:aminoglycoside 3'-phosphotransferase [Microbacterium sp.]